MMAYIVNVHVLDPESILYVGLAVVAVKLVLKGVAYLAEKYGK